MNREIKFRAWNTENKTMLKAFRFEDISTQNYAGESWLWLGENELLNTKLADLVLMQFTGLHDKNGKDIYEGDILATADLDFKCVVTFEDGCFQLKTNNEQGNSPLVQDRAKRLKIIGNIHENPELL